VTDQLNSSLLETVVRKLKEIQLNKKRNKIININNVKTTIQTPQN